MRQMWSQFLVNATPAGLTCFDCCDGVRMEVWETYQLLERLSEDEGAFKIVRLTLCENSKHVEERAEILPL